MSDMTDMTELVFQAPALKTLLCVLLFLTSLGELALLIYKLSHRAPAGGVLWECLLLLIPSMLFVILAQPDAAELRVWGYSRLPVPPDILSAAVILPAALHLVTAFLREYRRAEDNLTTDAIREATDNLPLGVCFEDPDGRIVLCNDTMHRVWLALTGNNLQTGSEWEEGLRHPPAPAKKLTENYIKLPDGRIYEFHTAAIAPGGTEGWRQFTAQDVTGQYAVNEQLREESEKLRRVNRRLRKLYAGMTDAIIEKETLEMKIYIHDTMGRSLITIKDILDGDAQTEKKLETLQEISALLSARHTGLANTMEEVRQLAGKLGVKTEVNGFLPREEDTARLIAAAARECITNCVKHARGNKVTIRIRRNTFMYTVTITNNGERPKEPVTEGSGLKNLRSAVEAEGGEMYISCRPAFALILNLPKKEEDEDD